MLVLATILGPIVVVFLSVSFATDHWLKFEVDRKKYATEDITSHTKSKTDIALARIAHTRNRGIFRECYPTNDTEFLARAPNVVDSYCFNIQYDIPEKTNLDYSTDYIARIHLMRCHLAFFIVAIVVFLLAYIFGLVLCCWRQSKWAYIAGLCAYIAAFSTAAAIAFFHGAEYLERNKINDAGQIYFYNQWPGAIQRNTERYYGWSYALGWTGMVLAAFTATFYSLAGCYIGGERYEDREHLEKGRGRDYMDLSYPMALDGPHPEYYYGHPRGRPMQGPYLYDMEARRPLPAIGYGPDPYWSWS